MGKHRVCEVCSGPPANYGVKGLGTRRWCSECAKKLQGVETARIGATGKMCEDCGETRAHYGLKDGKKQWCASCAKTHGGVYLGQQKMCVDCKDKWANYGLPDTTQRRWCFTSSSSNMRGWSQTNGTRRTVHRTT